METHFSSHLTDWTNKEKSFNRGAKSLLQLSKRLKLIQSWKPNSVLIWIAFGLITCRSLAHFEIVRSPSHLASFWMWDRFRCGTCQN